MKLDKQVTHGQTYESKLLQLGAHAGRQYESPSTHQSGGRFSRLRHQIHQGKPVQGCKVCSALQDSGSPIHLHESELPVPGGYHSE
jgi:hypothetical protein